MMPPLSLLLAEEASGATKLRRNVAPLPRRIDLNSHAGVLGAGRDLGWRNFSLLVCRFLGGNVNPLRGSPGFNNLRSLAVAVARARVDVNTNRIVPTVEAVTRQNDAALVA